MRWAVKRGAQVVFHPHFHEAEPGSYRPATFADPANTFHEKAALCRAAENTCFFATVNYASDGSPTTSAVVRPDGTVLAYQPYGKAGLLIADLESGRRHTPAGDTLQRLLAAALLERQPPRHRQEIAERVFGDLGQGPGPRIPAAIIRE